MTVLATHLIDYPSPMDPETVNNPTIYDLDVRQDAHLRLFRHYQKRGEPYPMTVQDMVQFHRRHESFVVQALNSSVIDQVRKIRGQGAAERNVVLLSDLGPEFDIEDSTAAQALDAVESSAADELEAFLESASEAEKEAVQLMQECQQLIEQGVSLKDSHRSKLKRLRQQTGLALDVSLL
jgi:hypothetical protein